MIADIIPFPTFHGENFVIIMMAVCVCVFDLYLCFHNFIHMVEHDDMNVYYVCPCISSAINLVLWICAEKL